MTDGDTQDREAMVRERAYAIWLERGQPQGEADACWREAEQALDAEEAALTPLADISGDPVLLIPPTR